MDYRKLSDFDINNRVAKSLGAKQVDSYENGERCAIYYELGDEALTVRKGQGLVNEQFDPCNNAADAWPIIFENGISLRKLHNGKWRAINEWGDSHQHDHENPLRAAMVVFLMMQGD